MCISAQVKQTLALLTNIRLGQKCLQLSYERDGHRIIYFITFYRLFIGKKGFLIDVHNDIKTLSKWQKTRPEIPGANVVDFLGP
jgi:hypothetical protein